MILLLAVMGLLTILTVRCLVASSSSTVGASDGQKVQFLYTGGEDSGQARSGRRRKSASKPTPTIPTTTTTALEGRRAEE